MSAARCETSRRSTTAGRRPARPRARHNCRATREGGRPPGSGSPARWPPCAAELAPARARSARPGSPADRSTAGKGRQHFDRAAVGRADSRGITPADRRPVDDEGAAREHVRQPAAVAFASGGECLRQRRGDVRLFGRAGCFASGGPIADHADRSPGVAAETPWLPAFTSQKRVRNAQTRILTSVGVLVTVSTQLLDRSVIDSLNDRVTERGNG